MCKNKMTGADMNRLIFYTYIYNVHCAKHFGANSKKINMFFAGSAIKV